MKYDDIINIDYNSIRKPKMSLEDRSAQFSPFQALEGYMDDVYETERVTQNKKLLDDNKKEEINNKILYLYTNNLEGIFTYFIKDKRKEGGSYREIKSKIKKIDYINGIIYFNNYIKVTIDDIVNIDY